ncbi:hypothetical protein [Cuneatibacter caecimuris]|uniref:Uncharacterized protein n=1 Tax=Cuneatibacter caecimuris TaxID=1796618 RepID=A0A4V2F842_9FIRM|nr:hypothetical protein [Cuneatibacter caecimuris]RZT02107.1 hypothetical protein EV209_0212 [Cuneatibacter caecimuris]
MTDRMILNRVKKLKELEEQKKEIESQIDALKADIQQDMEEKGLEEQKAGDFLVRFTRVLSNRFDSRAFREEHSRLYSQYLKQTESRRFSIV